MAVVCLHSWAKPLSQSCFKIKWILSGVLWIWCLRSSFFTWNYRNFIQEMCKITMARSADGNHESLMTFEASSCGLVLRWFPCGESDLLLSLQVICVCRRWWAWCARREEPSCLPQTNGKVIRPAESIKCALTSHSPGQTGFSSFPEWVCLFEFSFYCLRILCSFTLVFICFSITFS